MAFFLTLAVIGLLSSRVYFRGEAGVSVHVKNSSGEWILPLKDPRSFSVGGPLGKTALEIAGGAVRVVSSPCPEKICVKAGPISRPGQWIACLPNRIFITIKGKSENKIDAFSF